jgi:hypothetical protein
MPYRNAASLNIRFPGTDGPIIWVWVKIVSSSDKGASQWLQDVRKVAARLCPMLDLSLRHT